MSHTPDRHPAFFGSVGSLLLICAVIVSACSAAESPSNTTTTSTTVATTTTSSIPDTTTSTISLGATTTLRPSSWDGNLLNPISPLEVLDSFSLQRMWFATDNDGGEYGLLASGQFVYPDGAYCRLDQPSFNGWVLLLMVTAIGDTVWTDDGFFGANESQRASQADLLSACPASAEYWESPPFLHESLDLVVTESVDEINGLSATKLSITSTVDDLTVDSGEVWITHEGWPIRFDLAGSGTAAAFNALFGVSGDGSPDQVEFEFRFEINEVNSGGLFVRAPDGSLQVGPLGDVTADVTPFEPSSGLAAIIRAHSGGECTERLPATASIMARLGSSDPGFDYISVQSTVEGTSIESSVMGTFVKSSTDEVFKSGAEAHVAELHAELHFNHYRSITAFFLLVGSPILLTAEDSEGREASWNFDELIRFDGSVEQTDYWFYHRMPSHLDRLLLGTEYEEAWAKADTWAAEMDNALAGLPSGHPQATADVKVLMEGFEMVEGLFCALLATGWHDAAQVFDTQGDAYVAANPDVLFDELSAQQLLLTLEYAELITSRLTTSGVDWFSGSDANFDKTSFDLVTSDTEFVSVLAAAGRDALALYFELRGS